MHDDMLRMVDDCLSHLYVVRRELAAARRVNPGERRAAVLRAIRVAQRFTADAERLLAECDPPPADDPRVPAVPRTHLVEVICAGAGSKARPSELGNGLAMRP